MAVDTEQIGIVYDALEAKVEGTLDKYFNKFSITEPQKAQVLSNAIITLIQISVQTVVDAPIKEEQKLVIFEQRINEVKKQELTMRQTIFYDDQLKMEEAKGLAQITMGFAMSGTTLPTNLLSTTLSVLDELTP